MAARTTTAPAQKPVTLTADQLSAAANFLRQLNIAAEETGAYPDSGFVIELPSTNGLGDGPRVKVVFADDDSEVEYVVGGLVAGDG